MSPEELGLQAAGRQLFPVLVFVRCGDLELHRVQVRLREGTRGSDLRAAVVLSALHPGASWRPPASGAGPGAGLWCPLTLLQACAEQRGLTAQLPARALWGACGPPLVSTRHRQSGHVLVQGGPPSSVLPGRVGERQPFTVFKLLSPLGPAQNLGSGFGLHVGRTVPNAPASTIAWRGVGAWLQPRRFGGHGSMHSTCGMPRGAWQPVELALPQRGGVLPRQLALTWPDLLCWGLRTSEAAQETWWPLRCTE